MLDGVHSQHFSRTVVIVYHSHGMGLVAVDKNTVAIAVSDVMLSFAAFPIETLGRYNLKCYSVLKTTIPCYDLATNFLCRWFFSTLFIIMLLLHTILLLWELKVPL